MILLGVLAILIGLSILFVWSPWVLLLIFGSLLVIIGVIVGIAEVA